ncbi:SH3 and multiple ankyrin repeat domains protein 3 [Liparis tanakae]|uniref:SH3 and multiple ankyrin repeat domains protein 3 n=1 Tax=Liparis tanakae TaxID=230148 RepID=A0A4Z2EYM7_9TELE|nr:SH3 and multiple ankyrin repeat domains protein 3 [Liparis tanakae]
MYGFSSDLACRYGHVQHLEHLLFYGADMSAQNASGNTALHVCALYNQESGDQRWSERRKPACSGNSACCRAELRRVVGTLWMSDVGTARCFRLGNRKYFRLGNRKYFRLGNRKYFRLGNRKYFNLLSGSDDQRHIVQSTSQSRHGDVPDSLQSTGSSRSSHSRSPSLHQLHEEDRPVPRRSHSHGHRGRLRAAELELSTTSSWMWQGDLSH